MYKMTAPVAVILSILASSALADETEGHILAYDRVDNILVLTDKTVWQLGSTILVPADLARGDRVHLEFASEGEEGVTEISGFTRLAAALPEGTDGGS